MTGLSELVKKQKGCWSIQQPFMKREMKKEQNQ